MIELRLRTRTSPAELASKVGKIVTAEDYNVLLTRAAKVRKPDGSLLCIYLPGRLRHLTDEAYDELARIRGTTTNRGAASGTERVKKSGGSRTYSKAIASSIIGAFDAYGGNTYCRLTAYNADDATRFQRLFPLFRGVAEAFSEHVPERYKVQAAYAARTSPEWVIPGTPFTTITVNSTYPTGVHTDSGDLEAGFSCLGVARRGAYTGGVFVFPEYRLGIDLQDGDLVLMDAHEWHGNTAIRCAECEANLDAPGHHCSFIDDVGGDEPERISVVCYYRTGMAECGDAATEAAKRARAKERQTAQALGLSEQIEEV